MKRIEKLIPDAIEIAREKLSKGKTTMPKGYKSAISSFGASILQAGILPTVAFYSEKGESEINRPFLLDAIFTLIKKQTQQTINEGKLIEYVVKNKNDKRIKQKILDSAIALKLAIRTFELVDTKK